jgi:hypothetical protein
VTADGRGLQAERTRLAWRRTTLAATAVMLLAVGRVVSTGARPIVVEGAALSALVWIAALVVAHQRIRELSTVRPLQTVRPPESDRGDPPRAPAALALLAAVLGLLAVLLVS